MTRQPASRTAGWNLPLLVHLPLLVVANAGQIAHLHAMRKRVNLLLAIACIAVAGVIAWRVFRPNELVYQGKTLTCWLSLYYPDELHPPVSKLIKSSPDTSDTARTYKADEAVIQIGTNAIPTLLRLLRAKDSTLKVKFMGLARKQSIIKVSYTPDAVWNFRAKSGFRALGLNDKAGSAVPALIAVARERISPVSQSCAIQSLGFIGPQAKAAVPSLLQWATNSNDALRISARAAVLEIDPAAAAKAGIKY